MSSSNSSTNHQTDSRSRGHCCGGWGNNGKWSGFNIAAMVLGFIIFWPIGLFIMFWIMSGRSVKKLPQGMQQVWNKATGGWGSNDGFNSGHDTDNSVFNDYQQTQHDRISEIKQELKERSRRFSEFRSNAKRRADEEEFNRFMSDIPGRAES